MAASRSGFDHKYPTAYESPGKKKSHYDEAVKHINIARKYRNQREVIRDKINAPPRP